MEKQRISGTSGSFKRLLSFLFTAGLLLICNSLSAQSFSDIQADSDGDILDSPEAIRENTINQIKSGEIVLTAVEGQDLFTEEDIKFEMIIPGFKPSEINMISDKNQDNAEKERFSKDYNDYPSFKSLKKYEERNDNGTKLQLWYSFNKKGNYSLLPVVAEIEGEEVEIKFAPVNIVNDPNKMMPEVIIKFSNGVTLTGSDIIENPVFNAATGESLYFTIYVQYASSLVKFNYDIPKDSIYIETRTYDILEGSSDKYKTPSNNLIPVADFQWTVPEKGIMTLPEFRITATSYNNKKADLSFPKIKINFVDKALSGNNISNGDFDSAFDESFQGPSESALTVEKNGKNSISLEDCQKLAELYSAERNSFFSYFGAKKARKDFEEELGLPGAKSTTSVGLIYIAVIFIILGAVILFFSIRKKKFFRAGTGAVVMAAAISLLCFTISRRSKIYGISKGCTIYSIPESNAEASCMIGTGSLVLVTETTDIWYHVELGEASGWCPKDNIIIVK